MIINSNFVSFISNLNSHIKIDQQSFDILTVIKLNLNQIKSARKFLLLNLFSSAVDDRQSEKNRTIC
mgnify:CR=1 FL=1